MSGLSMPARYRVSDLRAEAGGRHGSSVGQVRDVVYPLLANQVLTAVNGNSAVTGALTADGALAVREIVSGRKVEPAMAMDIRIDRDISSGVTVVDLSGELTTASSLQVRQALAKCVAECPAAVIVNLRDVRLDSFGQVAVFATASEHAIREYGVPVLYAEVSAELALRLAAFGNSVRAFPTLAAADRGLSTRVPRWMCRTMQPVAASLEAARVMVGEACLRWDLASLRDPAERIASELVANAVYTRQPFDITVSHSTMYLRIGVRDSSVTPRFPPDNSRVGTLPPRQSADAPAGLKIVQALADRWGSTPTPDGTVVWAMLRT